ncbi:MAG: hypothetical protein R3E39_20265 [Anaerolineae bacterium]
MQSRATRYGVVVTLLLAFLLAACGGGGNDANSSSSGGSPADAAKSLFTAMFKGEDVSGMLCAAAPDGMKEGLDAMKAAFTTGGAEVDTSGMTFTVKSESGDKAEVEVAGKLKVTVAGTSTEQDWPSSTIPLTKENGAWKACG